MNYPIVEYLGVRPRILNPSRGYANSITIVVDTVSEEFLENPITGRRTFSGRSTPISPAILFNINLRSLRKDYIIWLLHNHLDSISHGWLYDELASFISVIATDLGFGFNGFAIDIFVRIAYQNIVILSDHRPSLNHEELSLRTVLLGRINRESLESLKTETESCSICLDDLSDSSKDGEPTRMNCSHVFHSNCLLEWLHRNNTCPLCRTVLYDRDDLEQ